MSGRFLRHALAWPGVLLRPSRRRAQPGNWRPPSQRQICTDHPTGHLAADPRLNSFCSGEGEVHFCCDGGTAFAVGVQGLSAASLRAWRQEMQASGMARSLIFPLASWERSGLDDAGFEAMKLGEEAELHLPSFTLAGGTKANLRQMLGRARRAGLSAGREDAAQLAEEAQEVQQRWRRSRPQPRPMRLLIGDLSWDLVGSRILVAVRGPQGQLLAWIDAAPGYAGRGYGIDRMVRAPEAPAGAMELAIITLATRLKDDGFTWLSLGAAPLRGVGLERPVLGSVCIALRRSALGNRLFNFAGLAAFKAKFAPRWRPVYLAASPRLNAVSLYEGCRLWGLF